MTSDSFAPVVPFNWQTDPFLWLDFTKNNPDLATLNVADTAAFSVYVFDKLRAAGAKVGVGGYNEQRVIYARSAHFQQAEAPRCVHLGIDIWAEAGTPVFVPTAARVHSFANNAHFGDYGPTVIVELLLPQNQVQYALYGHLSVGSLTGLYEGMAFEKGSKLGEIGHFPENGDWPPHLHFQLINDLLGMRGDFPGVCTLRERDQFLKLCPDPSSVLRLAK